MEGDGGAGWGLSNFPAVQGPWGWRLRGPGVYCPPSGALAGPDGIGCSCPGNTPLLGTSIQKCQTVSGVRPGSLPPSPSPFSAQLPLPKSQTSSVSMAMEEGCPSFSIPNICLYKQLCAAPPPGPGLQAWAPGWGGSALFIRGVGFLAPLGWAERAAVGGGGAASACGSSRASDWWEGGGSALLAAALPETGYCASLSLSFLPPGELGIHTDLP